MSVLNSIKNVVLMGEQIATEHKLDKETPFVKALTACREFLEQTKGFEYEGPMELEFQASIKLKEIKTDFDDVIRGLVGKRSGIKGDIYLCLLMVPEPVEVKETKGE